MTLWQFHEIFVTKFCEIAQQIPKYFFFRILEQCVNVCTYLDLHFLSQQRNPCHRIIKW